MDDLDGFAVAYELLLVLDDDLAGRHVTREVVRAVEVVETREGGDTHPVVERHRSPCS